MSVEKLHLTEPQRTVIDIERLFELAGVARDLYRTEKVPEVSKKLFKALGKMAVTPPNGFVIVAGPRENHQTTMVGVRNGDEYETKLIRPDEYPLPPKEDIRRNLEGGVLFVGHSLEVGTTDGVVFLYSKDRETRAFCNPEIDVVHVMFSSDVYNNFGVYKEPS